MENHLVLNEMSTEDKIRTRELWIEVAKKEGRKIPEPGSEELLSNLYSQLAVV
jgi:hypothetical protein